MEIVSLSARYGAARSRRETTGLIAGVVMEAVARVGPAADPR